MVFKSKKTSDSKEKVKTSKKATKSRTTEFVPVPSLEPEVATEVVAEIATEPEAPIKTAPKPRSSKLAPEVKKEINWKAVRTAVYAAGYDTTVYGSDLDKVVEVAKAHGADAVRKLHWLGSANLYANLIARLTK